MLRSEITVIGSFNLFIIVLHKHPAYNNGKLARHFEDVDTIFMMHMNHTQMTAG